MCQRDVLLSRGTEPGWTAQQGGAQSPVPGEEQPQDTLGDTQLGDRKGPGALGEHQDDQGSPEGELCPGPCWDHCYQKVKEGIPPCSALGSSSLDSCAQLGAPQCERDRDILERVKH